MSETETPAAIHITREMQLGGFGVRAHVSMDGVHVGALWVGGKLTLPAAPGTRLIRVEGRGLGALTLESCWLKVRLGPGDVAALRITTRKGVMKSRFVLEPEHARAPGRG
jgi:hypothetical protein